MTGVGEMNRVLDGILRTAFEMREVALSSATPAADVKAAAAGARATQPQPQGRGLPKAEVAV